ncbi:major facilitator superfamily domain-containing protein [Thermoascus aurantiacus ATCC 26904]
MHSLLQYRRMGKQLEAQLKRNREKTAELKRQRRQLAATTDASSGEVAVDDEEVGEKEDREGEGDHVSPSRVASQSRRSSLLEVETARDVERADFDTLADLETVTSQATMSTTLGTSLTGVDVRSQTTLEGELAMGKVFVVSYESDEDPMNPRNWPFSLRVACTIVISLVGAVVGFASSIDSAALRQGMKAFGVSDVAESLATALYLIGFGAGSLISGPFSEAVGRNPVYIATLAIFMLFIMGAGLARKLGTQLVCRFFAGLFGSTPLVCAGGSLSDLWTPFERVYAFPIFACSAFVGPVCGPIPGGYIGQIPWISWHWVEWITLSISGLVFALVFFFQPETYGPILLKWKAMHLRRLTGVTRYRAPIEVRETTFLSIPRHVLYRPFLLLVREPIIILIALYLTVIFVIFFTFLTGYKFIFRKTYHFSEGLTGVCFVGILIGIFMSGFLVPVAMKLLKRDLARALERGQTHPPPEMHLRFAMCGAPAIPASLFWMGWTARPSISPWSPLASSLLFGYGIICVFISCYQYVIDSYEEYSASALASVTLIRYVAAGVMVEVSFPFYKNLGVAWTLTILGALSAVLVPVPYVFFWYGPAIRKTSWYASMR